MVRRHRFDTAFVACCSPSRQRMRRIWVRVSILRLRHWNRASSNGDVTFTKIRNYPIASFGHPRSWPNISFDSVSRCKRGSQKPASSEF